MTADAYPLAWPEGWPRTPFHELRDGRSHFGRKDHRETRFTSKRPLTFAEARDNLLEAVDRIGGRDLVLSTNFPLNSLGLPRGDRRRPADEGVAIYFTRKGQPMVMARDAFTRAEENMRSLAMALEAMAQLERHGGSGLAGRAFRGFVALPQPKRPHEVLGCSADASESEIRAAWKRRISQAHPDQGGSDQAAGEVNAARDAMIRALRSERP